MKTNLNLFQVASELKAHNIVLKEGLLEERSKKEVLEQKIQESRETSRLSFLKFLRDFASEETPFIVSYFFKRLKAYIISFLTLQTRVTPLTLSRLLTDFHTNVCSYYQTKASIPSYTEVTWQNAYQIASSIISEQSGYLSKSNFEWNRQILTTMDNLLEAIQTVLDRIDYFESMCDVCLRIT